MYLIKNKPNTFYSSYIMSQSSSQHQSMISDCYDELMADPFLLQSEDKWMIIHGLPYLPGLCFCFVSERLFTWLTSPALWRKARADFIPNVGRRAMSADTAPLVIFVMDRIGEGKLGMRTTICSSDQVKVEPLDALSTLVQWDPPEPGTVVMKVFTNFTHLLQGSFGTPNLC